MTSIKKYKNYIYEKQINDLIFNLSSINEYYKPNDFKIKVSSKEDAKTLLDIALDKIDDVKDNIKDHYKKYIIAAIIGYLPINYIVHQFDQKEKKPIKREINSKSKYKDPQTLHISAKGIEMIKNHEKLKLVAYDLKDGKITIGYGRAYDVKHSPYKVGDKITPEKATKYLKQDLKWAEDGVKRMFKDWKKEGYDIKISQNQFDAIVSLTYNTGIRGMRNTTFVEFLKNSEFKKAGEILKKTKVSDEFKGSYVRREAESNLFLHNDYNTTDYTTKKPT